MLFHYTVTTTKTVQDAALSLEKELKEEKFGVLWQFNIKEKLAEKGLELDDQFLVLEVCNPVEAERVISKNKLVGYFLPCKIVLYEENGQVKMGMPKPSQLISMVEDDSLKEIALEIEDRLIKCINEAS